MSRHLSYQLVFPAEVTAEAVAAVLRVAAAEPRGTALSPAEPLVFETLLHRTSVTWWLRLTENRARTFMTAAERELHGISFVAGHRPLLDVVRAVELRIDSRERLLDADLAEATIARLLTIASGLRGAETVLVQWQVGAWLPRSPIPPATGAAEPRTIWNLPDWGNPVRDSEQVTAARKKQAEHLFGAVGRVAVAGASDGRATSLLTSAVGAYQLLRAPGVGISRRALPSWWVRRRLNRTRVSQIDPAARLTASELAGIVGWPVGNPTLPGVRYTAARRLPLDERVLVKEMSTSVTDRVVGASAYPAQAGRQAVLRPTDGLRHLHLLGPTGVGKSTAMARLILGDIAAGRGVVAIDPKGDLITDVVARVPERHQHRVVVLDPTDAAPVGLNPLRDGAVGIDGVLHVLRSVWHDSWGPRLGDILHAGLLTLAMDQRGDGHSLSELPLLLGDDAFRRPLVSRAVAQDRLGLGTFWPWFDSLSDESRVVVLAPVMNKLRALLMRPELRAVLGQANPRLNLRSVFTDRTVLLVRLPKGQLGTEGVQLLGSLLVAQLWRQTMSRSAIPAGKRHPVFFYLDEFQEFLRLNLDLSDALVQARGLGVGLVLAHQHLEQLDRSTRSAVLANAGSRIAFRLDSDDAGVIAKRSGGRLRPEDLSGLDAYEAYASLMNGGDSTPYGSLATLPLGKPLHPPEVLLRRSRERFGVPAVDTETRLHQLIDGGDRVSKRAPVGGRRRSSGDREVDG